MTAYFLTPFGVVAMCFLTSRWLHSLIVPRKRGCGAMSGMLPHGAAHGRARLLVLGPDEIRRLRRDGHPAAGFANELRQTV